MTLIRGSISLHHNVDSANSTSGGSKLPHFFWRYAIPTAVTGAGPVKKAAIKIAAAN